VNVTQPAHLSRWISRLWRIAQRWSVVSQNQDRSALWWT